MLCKECETLFSRNETKVSKLFSEINSLDVNARKWLANVFPPNFDLVARRILERKNLDSNALKGYDFFNRANLNELKFYCLGVLIRESYKQENPSISKKIKKKIEDFFNLDKTLNVEMHILVNINANDFTMASTSHTINSGKYFHIHFIFPNIFVYLQIREDNSIEQDNFVILPEDFFNIHHKSLPLISAINYYKKLIEESRIAQNAKNKMNSNGIHVSEIFQKNPL